MIKHFLSIAALLGALVVSGCMMDMSMPSTEMTRRTVDGETYVLYDTHHGMVPGQDIYDIRWAKDNRHFRSYVASSDERAIELFEAQIRIGLEKWANCEGAGQRCPN